jgi:hypothetical protein
MTDEAIPFERKFTVLTDKQKADINDAIKAIGKADASLDKILPRIVEAVTAGDNVAIANRLLAALRGSRRKPVLLFLQAFLPHELRNTGKFGKRLPQDKARRKERLFRKWLDKGETFSAWSSRETKVERKPVSDEKRVENALKAAFKHGMTTEKVLEIMHKVAEAAEAAKEPEAAAA